MTREGFYWLLLLFGPFVLGLIIFLGCCAYEKITGKTIEIKS